MERLAIGDRVVTASGELRPIRWLGHRRIDCTRHPEPRSVWPVRVSADAFGAGRPCRDLLVSPGHALCVTCVDEVLIPADRLVNGATIVQQPVDRVTYWHVELDSHDILIADGMPAESYLEMGNRVFFVGGDAVCLHGRPDGAGRTHADYCRMFVDPGTLLDVVRGQVLARAERLGWVRDAGFDCHLMVDGGRVEVRRSGGVVEFEVPASARAVRLVSERFVPDEMDGRGDRRVLGVNVVSLMVGEGGVVGVDDARLGAGFHAVEREGERIWRWTDGDAVIPCSVWAGMVGVVSVRVGVDGTAFRRWRGPGEGMVRRVG